MNIKKKKKSAVAKVLNSKTKKKIIYRNINKRSTFKKSINKIKRYKILFSNFLTIDFKDLF